MAAESAALRYSGPAQSESIDCTHELLEQLWRLHPQVAELDRLMFATAVLEVANNILTHGQPAAISLELTADARELQAKLTDDGAAAVVNLDEAAMPDTWAQSGRGLAMVRMAVDDVSHHYVDGRNHWHLVRRRQG